MLLRGDSAVDRFRKKGQHGALTAQERHGFWLYESKGRCWRCHRGANFSDEEYHNTGVTWGKETADAGRHAVTKKEADRGKFKTPTLREVGRTGPYMHNGRFKTLAEVVQHYNFGGVTDEANDYRDERLQVLYLVEEQVNDLVKFLSEGLTTPSK